MYIAYKSTGLRLWGAYSLKYFVGPRCTYSTKLNKPSTMHPLYQNCRVMWRLRFIAIPLTAGRFFLLYLARLFGTLKTAGRKSL